MKKAIALAALASALAVSVPAEARTLKLGTAAPEKTPWGQFYIKFGQKVAEYSGGKLTIKNFFSAALGDEQEVIRQTARGRIDMAGASTTAASLIVPEFALVGAPYLFDTLAESDCAFDKHMIPLFGPMFEARGLVPVAWSEVGNQIFFTKEAIKAPGDIKGQKIRSAPTKTDTLYVASTGATAVPLGVADTMPALKTGGVSGATWPTVYGIAVGYHKVAPYITATNHVHQVGVTFVSKKVWDSLSADERKAIQRASDEVFPALRKAIRGAESAFMKKAADQGATIYTPTAAEMKQWQSTAPAVIQQVIQDTGGKAKDVFAKMQAARAACKAN